MNRNRRRSGESTATGFWSTFMGRNQERRPSDHEFSQEPDPISEPPAAVGQWQWEDVSRHIPFILYCTFLLLIYIANGHSQESMQRKILSTRQEVEDLKAEYILLQSEVMHLGRRTEVLSRLQHMGMGWKTPQEPPVVLDADDGATNAKKKGT